MKKSVFSNLFSGALVCLALFAQHQAHAQFDAVTECQRIVSAAELYQIPTPAWRNSQSLMLKNVTLECNGQRPNFESILFVNMANDATGKARFPTMDRIIHGVFPSRWDMEDLYGDGSIVTILDGGLQKIAVAMKGGSMQVPLSTFTGKAEDANSMTAPVISTQLAIHVLREFRVDNSTTGTQESQLVLTLQLQ